MDLGAVLREARERRGLSLDDLARATKINPSTLRAIEASQFDRPAHGIFVRGFLRAYAHEVGLDAEEIVRRYKETFEPEAPAAGAAPGAEPAPPRVRETFDEEPSTSRTILLLAVLVAVAVGGYVMVRQPRPATVTESPAPDPVTSTPAVAPVATSGAATPAPAAPAVEGVRIDIMTNDDCWIAATADGVRVAFEVVPEGNHRTFEAHDELVMRIGRPAALTYTINGMPGRPLGSSGEPLTVRFTPQSYRDYLAP